MSNKLVQSFRDFAQDLRKDAKTIAGAVYVSGFFDPTHPITIGTFSLPAVGPGQHSMLSGLFAALVYALFKAAPVIVEFYLASTAK